MYILHLHIYNSVVQTYLCTIFSFEYAGINNFSFWRDFLFRTLSSFIASSPFTFKFKFFIKEKNAM